LEVCFQKITYGNRVRKRKISPKREKINKSLLINPMRTFHISIENVMSASLNKIGRKNYKI